MNNNPLGGIHKTKITKEDQELINSLAPSINTQLGSAGKVFTIVEAWYQIVKGTNKFFHLLGQPGTEKVTV